MPILADTVDVPLNCSYSSDSFLCIFLPTVVGLCILFCFLLLITRYYYSHQMPVLELLDSLLPESAKGLGIKCSGVTLTQQWLGAWLPVNLALEQQQTLRCNVHSLTPLQDQVQPRHGPKLFSCLTSPPSLSCFHHFPTSFSWDPVLINHSDRNSHFRGHFGNPT